MNTANFLASDGTESPVASGTMKVRILRSGIDSRVEKEDRVAVEAPLEYLLHPPGVRRRFRVFRNHHENSGRR